MPYVNKKRPYKKEYEEYQGTPEQIKKRAQRNKARAELMKDGRVSKGDGKDVDHVKPLSKGGSSSKKNLRVESAGANRSFSRNPDHTVKRNTPKK
jgi:5-methylcytosine-specific restriction endonuclease McrA